MLFTEQLFLGILIFVSLGLLITLSNLFWMHRFEDYELEEEAPFVSILVPARNEEHNIEACVRSLLKQNYPNFEVVVLDDHSEDHTGAILARLASKDGHLRVLKGKPLPEGWLGKHWACQQLSEAARGELLLFTDADTRHHPGTLSHSVAALLQEDADLVTAFPRQEVHTWGEKLVVPNMAWGIFSYIPVRLAQQLHSPMLTMTIGQFMLFRRTTFQAIGGFEAVRDNIVDDVALGRLIADQGYEWRLLNGTRFVSCRMYRNFWQAVNGFGKSMFAVFDYRILPYIVTWLVVVMGFLEPVLALFAQAAGAVFSARLSLFAWLSVLELLAFLTIAFKRLRFPLYLVPFFPLSVFLFVLMALRSMVLTLTGHATWKDRELDKVRIRWI
jgi:chlorobactene glucosyltransferase